MSDVALRAKVPGSVRAWVREVDDRPVVWVEVDASDRRGALTSEASSMLQTAAEAALHARLPLVGVIRSSGADIVEGFAALHGWGRAARALTDCSGVVPTIFVVDGPAVSGPALLLGLADHVVMTEEAYAFVSGPTMVAEFTGVAISTDELGGASAHSRYTGAATLVAHDLPQWILAGTPDDVQADLLVAVELQLLERLPGLHRLHEFVPPCLDPRPCAFDHLNLPINRNLQHIEEPQAQLQVLHVEDPLALDRLQMVNRPCLVVPKATQRGFLLEKPALRLAEGHLRQVLQLLAVIQHRLEAEDEPWHRLGDLPFLLTMCLTTGDQPWSRDGSAHTLTNIRWSTSTAAA